MPSLVSVIIPSFNHARYIKETLDSVFRQIYRPLEVIVVDDASTDHTADVLRAYGDRVRVRRLERNSGGPARPRNVALDMAQGAYVSIFDSDDLMQPEKLLRQITFLEKYPDIPLVFSDFENFDSRGRVERFLSHGHEDFQGMPKARLAEREYRISSRDAYETLIADNFIGTSGMVFRRSLIEAIGRFDEGLSNSDDVDFLFRAARKFDLGYIDGVLHKRRVHSENISSRATAFQAKELVYERLHRGDAALSPKARKNLDGYLSDLYFSRGYWERVNGSRKLSIQYYFKSWALRKSNLWVVKSIIRALLPY